MQNLSKLQKTVYNFLRLKNIRSGSCKTPLFVLYYHYRKYCWRGKIKKPVSPIEFARRLSVYFQKGKSNRYSYYLTNFEPPPLKRRRRIKLWYNRIWSEIRNERQKKS